MLKTAGFIAQALTISFFSIQSFATNISSLQTGDINLGSSSSATLNLNNGGILNGNLTMGNSSQITTFNAGILNGTINGAGKIIIATNTILNGNIGALNAVSSLTINAGKILDLSINNNSINASGSFNIASGATLLVGSGTISASIQASTKGSGTVKFVTNNTLGGSVGTATSTLSLVEISSGTTLNSNTRGIDATTISIADNGTFNYGNGTISGEVEGKNSGVGNLIFNNTKTTNFNIGQTNQLANINIVDGATITLGGNICANTIKIGNGVSGRLKSHLKNITANNIIIAKGASLEILSGSAVIGDINGDAEGNGLVQFSGSSAISQSHSLGATTKLAQILISNEATLNINDNIIFNADDITIGEGSGGGIGTPILNQNNGKIGADDNSQILLNSDSVFNYNGGIINGTIHGTSSNKGTFNVNNDYTNNFEIGKSFDLANLNIASGKTLTANANISVNNISVAGTLNLGNSSKTITGNLTTNGGATIDLGVASHTISGNFITASGDILKLKALNNSNIGNLKIASNAVVVDGTGLKISFNSDDGYLSDGTNFAIISAASGAISAVGDKNIDVNNSGSNQSGLLTFHTTSSNNNLFLSVDRKGAETFSRNKSVAIVYDSIDQTGSSATGELRNLQKFIDSNSTNNFQKEAVLKSAIPQNNKDLNNSSFNSAKDSLSIAESRLNKKNSDTIFDNQAIWIQGFGSSATQENVGDFYGYNYSNHGLAIGVDQEIAEDLRLGISASFSSSITNSASINKRQTNIDSYQFNVYGGYNFAPYFVDGILGVAINHYNSSRTMPEINLTAGARYSGQTYIAKFETGMIQELGYGLIVTHKISLTAAENQIATYSESGAGTLNLTVSNQHTNFLEGRFGSDLSYDSLEIFSAKIKPKIKLSYGYDFLGKAQSSTNHFQGQNSSFQIKNPNVDKASLKYGFGFDIYEAEGILLTADYDVEKKSSYLSKSSSLYLRYDF